LPHLKATPPPHCPPCTPIDSATILALDVLYVIQKYPAQKSPGPDGAAHAFYNHLTKHEASGPLFVADLARLFSFFRLVNVTPTSWNTAITTLLPKDHSADTCPITSSRPIALTAMLRRYFEGLLLITMEHQPWAKLESAQAGFRKRQTALQHVMLSLDAVNTSSPAKSKIQVHLDLKSAYDRTSHQAVLNTLLTRGCPAHDIQLIRSLMLDNVYTQVVVNGALTNPIHVTSGIFQGSRLSPFIFNLVIDAVIAKLRQVPGPSTPLAFPTALFYADDIRIQIPGYHVDYAQELINQCHSWALRVGLEFNLAKCGVIGLLPQDSLTINRQDIPTVKSYNYLGFEFTENGIDWKKYWTRVVAKAHSALRALHAYISPTSTYQERLNLALAFVWSHVAYGAPIYGICQQRAKLLNHPPLFGDSLLNSLHLDVLDFVFATRLAKNHIRIASWLANLPEWSYQLAARVTAFYTLLHRLDPSNLYTITWNKFKSDYRHYLAVAPNTPTSCLNSSPEVISYLSWCATTAITADHRYHKSNYLLWRAQLFLSRDSDHKLVSYLTPGKSRLKPDGFLVLDDLNFRVMILNWRINRFPGTHGASPVCTSCAPPDDRFNRSHFNECALFRDSNIVSDALWARFAASRQHRQSSTFSILDFLLNRGEFDRFREALAFYQSHSDPIVRWL